MSESVTWVALLRATILVSFKAFRFSPSAINCSNEKILTLCQDDTEKQFGLTVSLEKCLFVIFGRRFLFANVLPGYVQKRGTRRASNSVLLVARLSAKAPLRTTQTCILLKNRRHRCRAVAARVFSLTLTRCPHRSDGPPDDVVPWIP